MSAPLKSWLVGILAAGGSAVLQVCAFPNINAWWAGLVCWVPMILWAYTRPSMRRFLGVGFLGSWLAWGVLLIWLRHVYPFWGWFGVGFLAFYNACFALLWLWGLRWVWGLCDLRKPAAVRLMCMLGVAGWWVVLEWARGWVLTGFPWLPLSASQWTQPVFLQVAEWTGAWGISFVLIFLNLCIAGYVRSLYALLRGGAGGPAEKSVRVGGISLRMSFHMELYVGILVLLGCVCLMTISLGKMRYQREDMFKAGIVQPWTVPQVKWDPEKAQENWDILKALTLSLRAQEPDVYFWPEAATPFPVLGEGTQTMRTMVEQLDSAIEAPLLMGNLSVDGDAWYNGIYVATPQNGVDKFFYAKQHLVPFGEYVPSWLPFVEKISPVQGSFFSGTFLDPLTLPVGDKTWRVGPLVCFEDIFPSIARDLVARGADFLYVATNNAWYGTEAGAYQHAAHAVLRAVENRRPVVRCGNAGWSGWIDEFGYAAALEELPDGRTALVGVGTPQTGTVYFRGAGTFKASRSAYFAQCQSFYVRHGDWFVWGCMGLVVLAGLRLRSARKTD